MTDPETSSAARPAGRRPFRVLALWILLAGVAACLCAIGVTSQQTTTYTSSVTFVLRSNDNVDSTDMLGRTLVALVPTRSVARGILGRAGVPRTAKEIADGLQVERPPGSAALTVSYEDVDKVVAQAVARTLVAEVTDHVKDLARGSRSTSSTYVIAPWVTGSVTTVTNGPPFLRNGLAGLLAGMILGGAASLVRDLLYPVANASHAAFDVCLPTKLANNRNVLDRLTGNLALGSNSSPRILVLGPVGRRTRAKFAAALASALSAERPVTPLESSPPEEPLSAEESLPPEEPVPVEESRPGPVVVVGPQTPGKQAWVEPAMSVDAIVLLVKEGKSTVRDLDATIELLPAGNVTSVLLGHRTLKLPRQPRNGSRALKG